MLWAEDSQGVQTLRTVRCVTLLTTEGWVQSACGFPEEPTWAPCGLSRGWQRAQGDAWVALRARLCASLNFPDHSCKVAERPALGLWPWCRLQEAAPPTVSPHSPWCRKCATVLLGSRVAGRDPAVHHRAFVVWKGNASVADTAQPFGYSVAICS